MPLCLLAALLAAWIPVAPARGDDANPPPDQGRCVGKGKPGKPPANGGRPFDLKTDPRPLKQKSDWELLDYKFDEKSGRLMGHGGRPASEDYVAWMYEPEDFSRERVPAYLWEVLVSSGLRLDEASCIMRAPSGKAYTRLDYKAASRGVRLQLRHDALEYLRTRLRGLDPSAPVPPKIIKDMETLSHAGTELPLDIEALLHEDELRVGRLSADVDAAYAQSTRFFDGLTKLQDLRNAAMPAVPGNLPPKSPTYVEPAERRLGKLLASELEERFSRTEAGRELLSRFRDKRGRVELPPILVLKLNQRPGDAGEPGAVFDPAMGAIVLNHWQAASILASDIPPKDRPAYVKGFSDSRALSLYLETNPRERSGMLDILDDSLYHELVHAWQDKRNRLNVEVLRGNAPGANPLAGEYEAHREGCRYVIEKSLSEPAALERSGIMDRCLDMLKNYDTFHDGIRSQYLESYAGSQDLPDVLKVQKERESMARRLMREGYRATAQALKLAGMRRGDEALKQAQADYGQREKAFIAERLPELRRRVAEALPRRYMAAGRPDLALQVIASLPASTPGLLGLQDKVAAQSAPLLTQPPETFPLQARLSAFAAMPQPWPVSLWPAYWRDAAAQVTVLKALAKTEKDWRARRDYLQGAAQWSSAARNDKGARAKILRDWAKVLKEPLRSQYLAYADELSSPMHGFGIWGNKQ